MIARLPEMHRQFRELAAQIDVITAALSMQAETDRAPPGLLTPKPTGRSILRQIRRVSKRGAKGVTRSLLKRSIGREIVADTSPSPWRASGGQDLRSDRRHPAAEMIGLVAGSGRFPILFAEAAQRHGLRGRLHGHQI